MLVLTRKRGESVLLGKDIRVKVVDVRGGVARIGFEAPHDMSIQLEERLKGETETGDNRSGAGQPGR